jgi:hypothetical protein
VIINENLLLFVFLVGVFLGLPLFTPEPARHSSLVDNIGVIGLQNTELYE